ncbi:MAG: hypothetical protein OEY27_03490, partial [Gammaproteobacteria bacterium]|nr:hypothetical protein [Gammaproteobacteria bacterium]
SVEIAEATLNRLINEVGILSDGGVAQPFSVTELPALFEECIHVGFLGCGKLPLNVDGFGIEGIPLVVCRQRGGGVAVLPVGDPVPWQWWISDMSVDVKNGSMSFTATVTTRVGNDWKTVTRSVGAAVRFDSAANRLKLDISDFKVPLTLGGSNSQLDVAPVDVAKYYGVTLPIIPQTFAVRLPDGNTRNVTGKVTSATPSYSTDTLKVSFDVSF